MLPLVLTSCQECVLFGCFCSVRTGRVGCAALTRFSKPNLESLSILMLVFILLPGFGGSFLCSLPASLYPPLAPRSRCVCSVHHGHQIIRSCSKLSTVGWTVAQTSPWSVGLCLTLALLLPIRMTCSKPVATKSDTFSDMHCPANLLCNCEALSLFRR